MQPSGRTDDRLSHERLEVYQLALRLNELVAELIAKMPGGSHKLALQLEEAAGSVPANIAEGAGRGTPREQAGFYRYARGSNAEVAAHLDRAVIYRRVGPQDRARVRPISASVARMLGRLIQRAEERAAR